MNSDKTVTATFNLISVLAPVISRLSPTSGMAGTVVAIKGKNFGTTQGLSYVRFGSVQASINSWTATQIKVVAPSGLSGAVPVTVTTSGGVSNNNKMYTYVISAQPLIDSLTTLKQALVSKIDGDLEFIVRGFGDAKNLQTTLFWFDWANAIFQVVTDTVKAVFDILSLFGSDVNQFLQTIAGGISNAETYIETASWYLTIENLWNTGSGIQLSIDGPTYTATIKKMIQKAEKGSCSRLGCAFGFNQTAYENSVRLTLRARSASPLRIAHRSADVQRNKFEIKSGVDAVKKAIAAKFARLIKTLTKQRTVRSDFPMDQIIGDLQGIKTKLTESLLRNSDLS